MTDELAASGVRSWALENHIVKFVLPDDLGPGYFSTRHMLKDVELFLGLARAQARRPSSRGLPPPATAGRSPPGSASTTTRS